MDLDPGWKPDPTKRYPERYWDGQHWTDRVRDGDDEVRDRFENAMATRLSGRARPPSLLQRGPVRLLLMAAVVGALAWFLTGLLPDLLDGLPPTATAATADGEGLARTATDLGDAATDGRWTIVAAYLPATSDEARSAAAERLRSCVDEVVVGADVGEFGVEPSPASTRVTMDLAPRPEALTSSWVLRVTLRHDGHRWVLDGPLEQGPTRDELVPCDPTTG